MNEDPRRRWVLSPVRASKPHQVHGLSLRSTTPEDDEQLANVLAVAYSAESIDFDPEADYYAGELRQWRTIDRADDVASRVAELDGMIVGATLIATELGAPFLYEVAVLPSHRRRGLARALLSASLGELDRRSEPAIAAWVTHGNVASERLLTQFGFRPTTPPLSGDRAIGLYRAAGAATGLDDDGIFATAAEAIEPGAARIWLFTDVPRQTSVVRVRATDVEVRSVPPDSDEATAVLARATPIGGYRFLAERP